MVAVLFYLLITLFGLVIGSFISALTYRIPRGVNIFKGRSFCDNCKSKITWRDNIPVFSFYFLGGKCRNCKTPISLRYPLIEFCTLLVFLFIYYLYNLCGLNQAFSGEAVCKWGSLLGPVALPYLLVVAAGMITVFVIDLEHQIIPDSIVLSLFALTFLILAFLNPEFTYINYLTAFAGASFLLILHLLTKGKGMGLGDVKLALLGGIVLGWPGTLVWMFLSFVVGAIVGLILILLKITKFGKHIAFGPFLVFCFFIAMVWGDKIFLTFFK